MTGRSLEFRISQLTDGTLPADEQAGLAATLQSDARARQTFDEYRRLQSRLDRTLATPAVRWDALAEQLSAVVAESSQPPAVVGRIAHSAPVWRRRFAVAASVLVATGAGVLAWHSRGVTRPVKVQAAIPSSLVIGPQVEVARGSASVQITIGPSAVASQGGEWRYAEGVVTAPPRVQSFSKATVPAADDDSHLH